MHQSPGIQFPDSLNVPFLSARNLAKIYGHVQALRDVSLDAFSGEVLAIVGDNGAGKSTLIKILAGATRPDTGSIQLQGQCFSHLTPRQAIRFGISTVYQDLSLVETRDVSCNIYLGSEPTIGPFIDKRKMRRNSRELLNRLQIEIPSLETPMYMLSGGQRQAVAVARAIHQGGRMVILDEPTAALGLRETEKVLSLIRTLRNQGLAVVLISHNLHHVFEVADRILVMRSGRRIGLYPCTQISPDEIVQQITGSCGNRRPGHA